MPSTWTTSDTSCGSSLPSRISSPLGGLLRCGQPRRGLCGRKNPCHHAGHHVYALDAKTGKVLWNAKNGDPEQGQTMTMAPLVVHDKVIVGISGGEYGVRGYLTAYDLNTGKMAWRAYSVGPDEDIMFDPDENDRWRYPEPGRARIPASRPGKGMSGSWAAAPPGVGTLTIPNSTWFTTAPAIPGRGIPPSVLATTNGPRHSSLAILTLESPHGPIR